MRGQRARAVIGDRIGELPANVRAVLDRIGDDPAGWLAIAAELVETAASRQALDAVTVLMGFALETTSRHHPLRDQFLGRYCTARVELAERFGVATRADILAGLRQLSGMPAGDARRPEMMSRLGQAYHDLYHHEDDPDALTEAIRWAREAVDQARDDHPHFGEIAYTAAGALRHRCELTRDPELVRETIRLNRAAASRLAKFDSREAIAVLLHLLYEQTDEPEALDEAIEVLGDWAEDATGAQAGVAHARLGNALRARYERTGDVGDLAEAVRTMRHAVKTMPVDHPGYPVAASNLSGVLTMAHKRGLDESIDGEAVRIVRTAAQSDDPLALNNLGLAMTSRFVETGDSRALREAIDTLQRAVDATPHGDPYLASRLGNLGEALYYSFWSTRDVRELRRAIDLGRQAVAADATGRDPAQANYLSSLSANLHELYKQTADLAALTEAAATARDSVAALRESDHNRPAMISSAIHVLRDFYVATKKPEVLEEAIELGRSELRVLPAGHHGRTGMLSAFAAALQRRYFDFGDHAAGRESRSLLLAASLAPDTPTNQIICARLAAAFSINEKEWEDAANAMAHAVKLLPRLASRQLVRADQERQLGTATGTVHDACACALNAGDPERALTLLEHGRGILFAQALENRDELAELREGYPDLAEQVERTRVNLANWSIDGAADADEQHDLALRWDRLTDDIRALPGFGHFLLPPPAEELLAAAVDGPVVLFSMSDFRSDAMILTPGGVEVVGLPGVTPEEIRRRAQEFLADDDTVTETLEWLWDKVTGPVLDHIGLFGPSGDSWPRVWWCPTGPLSFLPLHAAGYHQTARDKAPRTVIDRVVSSYTPTVRALLHARRGRRFDTEPRALVVAMPNAAGAADLPGVIHEAEILADLPHRPTVLGGADAVRERVLAELPRHGWVHFACHGFSDLRDPSASYLLLGDDATKPLTVLDISRLHLDNADLACLSACSTAQVGATLTDEAIHLAAAFNLAGYRHVIATLWPVKDRPTARFIHSAYTMITAHGSDSAAYAVHTATREARDRYPRHPHVWAAYIHTGA